MQLTIKFFGRLQETTSSAEHCLTLVEGTSVSGLLDELSEQYPALAGQSFKVAVNRQLAPLERCLVAGDEIALLPPFSGG